MPDERQQRIDRSRIREDSIPPGNSHEFCDRAGEIVLAARPTANQLLSNRRSGNFLGQANGDAGIEIDLEIAFALRVIKEDDCLIDRPNCS